MVEPQEARGLALTVAQLTSWVCADYLWISLCERKKYISTFVLTFFFLHIRLNLILIQGWRAQRKTNGR